MSLALWDAPDAADDTELDEDAKMTASAFGTETETETKIVFDLGNVHKLS